MADLIPQIKTACDCRDLVRRFWPDHFREKSNCLCFVHEDSNESLQVSRELAYCHGCGARLDAIDLYQRGASLSKGDAIRELARELGLNNGNKAPGRKDLQGRWDQFKCTPLSAEAISYLEEKRGLPGIVDLLSKAGLVGFAPANQHYAASIVFPLVDWSRKSLLGLQYVPIDGQGKKFSTSTPARSAFFRLDGRGADFTVVTEGIINGLSALMACRTIDVDVAAILGAGFTDKLKDMPVALNPVLFFDNDDAGRKAATEAIQVMGGKCRVVDWSLAPDGMNDVNDLLKAGHADVIERMVRTSRVPKPADYARENAEPNPSEGEAGPPCIEITEHSAARFLDTPPPPIQWHLKGEPGSLKAGTFGIIVADGGTGKGHLLLQAGLSTATRIPFLDGLFEVPENAHGKCVLILGEDSEDILHGRFAGICESLIFDANAVMGGSSNDKLFREMIRENLFIISTCGVDLTLTSFTNGEMSTTPMFNGLLEALRKIENLKLVCIDPLSRIFSGDENDPAQTTYLSTLMERISLETGAGILVAHHTNKYSQQTDTAAAALTQHAVRGSTGLVNACRWMLTMCGVKQPEYRALGIPKIDVPRYVAAQVTKSNYSAKGGCFYLRRDDNGCLRLANIEGEQSEKDAEVTEPILKEIACDPCKYTKRAFCRVFSKQFEGYGWRRLEKLVDWALHEGHLVTVPATSKKGPVEHLAVSDTYEAG